MNSSKYISNIVVAFSSILHVLKLFYFLIIFIIYKGFSWKKTQAQT